MVNDGNTDEAVTDYIIAKELLDSLGEEVQPCELGTHDGVGEWYISTRCPACENTNTALSCHTHYMLVLKLMKTPGTVFDCLKCENTADAAKAVTSMVRR